ncbi:hypothetical protein FB451DRAFT_1365419 [Mycena latifolia]|nr:hypothetical protein FB451DRAFT_1365419 [Mycena latifolia]
MNLRPRGRHRGPVASAATSSPVHTSTDECTALTLSSDAIRTSLNLLKEAADVLPPLKSAAGGVLAVWDLADRVSASDENAQALAWRAVGILDAIYNAVGGGTSPIPPSMLADIVKFEVLLRKISIAMEEQLKQGRLRRVLHLRIRESRLARFTSRLDAASEAFKIGSSTRVELAVEKIQADVSATAADMSSTAALVVVVEQSNIRLRDEAVVREKSNIRLRDEAAVLEKSNIRLRGEVQVLRTVVLFGLSPVSRGFSDSGSHPLGYKPQGDMILVGTGVLGNSLEIPRDAQRSVEYGLPNGIMNVVALRVAEVEMRLLLVMGLRMSDERTLRIIYGCTYNITHSTGYTTSEHGSARVNTTEGESSSGGGWRVARRKVELSVSWNNNARELGPSVRERERVHGNDEGRERERQGTNGSSANRVLRYRIYTPDAPLDLPAHLAACSAVSNATLGKILPPVMSARISTRRSARVKFGRVEMRAKLPMGDWLWPAIWMLPVDETYGGWPLSGAYSSLSFLLPSFSSFPPRSLALPLCEIDIMEARENGPSYPKQGINYVRSSLNWGPATFLNVVAKTYGWTTKRRGREQLSGARSSCVLLTFFLLVSTFVLVAPPLYRVSTAPLRRPHGEEGPMALLRLGAGAPTSLRWTAPFAAAPLDFLRAQDQWYPSWPPDPAQRAMVIDSVKMWEKC